MTMILCRWALGLLILFFGANGIWHFFRVSPNPPRAEHFRQALLDTGYMLPLWKTVEFLGATLLLLDRWVPFALILLAPVLINIFLFHLFLAPRGLGLAALLLFFEGVLVWAHRNVWMGLF